VKQFFIFLICLVFLVVVEQNSHAQIPELKDSTFKNAAPNLDSIKTQNFSSIETDTLLNKFSKCLEDYKKLVTPDLKIDSLASQAKSLKKLPKVQLSGEIQSESFVTNYLDPFTPSEKVYTRVFGAPTVTIANLPFQVNFFYSTEANSYLNTNSIGVQFDVAQYKQNLKSQALEKLSGYKQAGQKIKKDKELLEKQKLNVKSAIDQKKNELLSLESQIEANKQELENRARAEIEKQKEKVRTKANEKIKESKDSLQRLKQNAQDSITREKENQKEKLASSRQAGQLDSLQKEFYKKKALYDSLVNKYEQYEGLYQKYKDIDSIAEATINSYKEGLSQDQVLGMASKRIKNEKIKSALAATNRLDFGLTYPSFNKYSIHGASVKGVDYGFSLKSTDVNLVGGRTFRNTFFALDEASPVRFDRNVAGISLDHNLKKSTFTQGFVGVWDSKLIEPQDRQHNFIYSLGYDFFISDKWKVSSLLAHSYVSSNQLNLIQDEEAKQNAQVSFEDALLNNWAASIESEFKLSPSSKFKVSLDQIQSGYQNIINPFLRKDNRELEAKISQKVFKRKVTLEANYKMFRDNLAGAALYTNRMQGYGLLVKSQFKKAPNFVLQYAPYQQGNNHPDSLFRTNNQLAVYSASVVYSTQLGKGSLTFLATAIQSHIDFSGMDHPVNNELFNASVSYQSGPIQATLMAYRNQTRPVVDSLNFSGVRLNLNVPLAGGMSLQANGFYDRYDNRAYRYSGILGISGQVIKKLTVSLNGEIGQIEGLYGLRNKRDVYSARLNLGYSF
jgi:hypothetical protein